MGCPVSHRPGSTCVIGKHTFTREGNDYWGANIGVTFFDRDIDSLGVEVSPPPSVPNVIEDIVFSHHIECFEYLQTPAEWAGQEALAVLKSAVVSDYTVGPDEYFVQFSDWDRVFGKSLSVAPGCRVIVVQEPSTVGGG